MRVGIFCLVLGYVLSQFFRAFLAVLTPVLENDMGASASDLAATSGFWFLSFAIMQIPVGAALDRIGPRITVAVLFAFGGTGGVLMFALAQSLVHINIAMILIGIGCSPILMASYYIFAKMYSPAVFATLAGVVIGVGSLGNLASSAPMAWAISMFGWRETMFGLAALTLAISIALYVFVKDPPKSENAGPKGSVLDVFKIKALWLIIPMMFVNYAPAAGIRGLWIGPYGIETYGADAVLIGSMTLVMALSMIAGNFAYGPLDRVFGTRKWVVFGGNAVGAVGCFILVMLPNTSGVWTATALFGLVGLSGASFPMIMAHARPFMPPHLTGRGVTVMNLFGIGGAGVLQFITARIMRYLQADPTLSPHAFQILFGFYGLLICCGLAIYAFSTDRTD